MTNMMLSRLVLPTWQAIEIRIKVQGIRGKAQGVRDEEQGVRKKFENKNRRTLLTHLLNNENIGVGINLYCTNWLNLIKMG